jgi:hypothetical protein
MNILSLLHQFPMQALLGSIVPIVQFMASRLAAMQSVHRKRRLREQFIALNAFISSAMDTSPVTFGGLAGLT